MVKSNQCSVDSLHSLTICVKLYWSSLLVIHKHQIMMTYFHNRELFENDIKQMPLEQIFMLFMFMYCAEVEENFQ